MKTGTEYRMKKSSKKDETQSNVGTLPRPQQCENSESCQSTEELAHCHHAGWK